MTDAPRAIDIAICTFKREHIHTTLKSLDTLEIPDTIAVRIIVADNDETDNARAAIEKTADEMSIPVNYIHAPARNISIARNACLDASTAPLLAFIDDDEWVESTWLSALYEHHISSKADIILGPVTAHYPNHAKDWISEGDFHATQPVWSGGTIQTGYTCNVLFNKKNPAITSLRFDEALGKTGGEDTAFFYAAYRAGATISYAENAVVHESVPAHRATLKWLLARRFRAGQSHASIILQAANLSILARTKNAMIAASKLCYCSWCTVFAANNPVRWRYWLLRGMLHVGVISRLLGKREIQQYG